MATSYVTSLTTNGRALVGEQHRLRAGRAPPPCSKRASGRTTTSCSSGTARAVLSPSTRPATQCAGERVQRHPRRHRRRSARAHRPTTLPSSVRVLALENARRRRPAPRRHGRTPTVSNVTTVDFDVDHGDGSIAGNHGHRRERYAPGAADVRRERRPVRSAAFLDQRRRIPVRRRRSDDPTT